MADASDSGGRLLMSPVAAAAASSLDSHASDASTALHIAGGVGRRSSAEEQQEQERQESQDQPTALSAAAGAGAVASSTTGLAGRGVGKHTRNASVGSTSSFGSSSTEHDRDHEQENEDTLGRTSALTKTLLREVAALTQQQQQQQASNATTTSSLLGVAAAASAAAAISTSPLLLPRNAAETATASSMGHVPKIVTVEEFFASAVKSIVIPSTIAPSSSSSSLSSASSASTSALALSQQAAPVVAAGYPSLVAQPPLPPAASGAAPATPATPETPLVDAATGRIVTAPIPVQPPVAVHHPPPPAPGALRRDSVDEAVLEFEYELQHIGEPDDDLAFGQQLQLRLQRQHDYHRHFSHFLTPDPSTQNAAPSASPAPPVAQNTPTQARQSSSGSVPRRREPDSVDVSNNDSTFESGNNTTADETDDGLESERDHPSDAETTDHEDGSESDTSSSQARRSRRSTAGHSTGAHTSASTSTTGSHHSGRRSSYQSRHRGSVDTDLYTDATDSEMLDDDTASSFNQEGVSSGGQLEDSPGHHHPPPDENDDYPARRRRHTEKNKSQSSDSQGPSQRGSEDFDTVSVTTFPEGDITDAINGQPRSANYLDTPRPTDGDDRSQISTASSLSNALTEVFSPFFACLRPAVARIEGLLVLAQKQQQQPPHTPELPGGSASNSSNLLGASSSTAGSSSTLHVPTVGSSRAGSSTTLTALPPSPATGRVSRHNSGSGISSRHASSSVINGSATPAIPEGSGVTGEGGAVPAPTLSKKRSFLSRSRKSSWEIRYDKIKELRWLGAGAQGAVFLGQLADRVVAVKKLKHCSNREIKQIKLLRKLTHQNIVEFVGVCTRPPQFCIIMEFCEHGPMFDVMKSRSLGPTLLLDWAMQIARGMNYLHDNKFIHRDLKSPNVLVSANDVLKISDFGTAREFGGISENMTFAGTVAWMAPEVIRNELCSEKVDVWSYGVVLWELLTAQIPYDGVDPSRIIWGVGSNMLLLPIPATCPEGFQLLLKQCWTIKPQNRPAFRQILSHLEILAENFLLTPHDEYLLTREGWQGEIKQQFADMKEREKYLRQLDESLIRKRESELEQAENVRKMYEEELQRTETMSKELYQFEAQLKQREADLARKEWEQTQRMAIPAARLATGDTSELSTSPGRDRPLFGAPKRKIVRQTLVAKTKALEKFFESHSRPSHAPAFASSANVGSDGHHVNFHAYHEDEDGHQQEDAHHPDTGAHTLRAMVSAVEQQEEEEELEEEEEEEEISSASPLNDESEDIFYMQPPARSRSASKSGLAVSFAPGTAVPLSVTDADAGLGAMSTMPVQSAFATVVMARSHDSTQGHATLFELSSSSSSSSSSSASPAVHQPSSTPAAVPTPSSSGMTFRPRPLEGEEDEDEEDLLVDDDEEDEEEEDDEDEVSSEVVLARNAGAATATAAAAAATNPIFHESESGEAESPRGTSPAHSSLFDALHPRLRVHPILATSEDEDEVDFVRASMSLDLFASGQPSNTAVHPNAPLATASTTDSSLAVLPLPISVNTGIAPTDVNAQSDYFLTDASLIR
ncbi:zipper protein kinase [Capsaspora owczarzaki ATCC 30864]|uniref:TKL/MLK/LZK protein kinase n=1 Tax=Capsaspora owczarzaki (strain ATCC 30864) TaxID=595528 RepID=A0A0D2X152_CAPO3|nr:zipper protein kinase [Capsaspora owczarzaki ATCC 30864]KJE90204.1 TKL/MLK/LZK protein kinase [Capsaspora owczarzaki ATCC 30864]|eukprot:XP_004364414.2 zipper protein kinase [Capsaspora owczarzaki ATCC 30864]